MNENLYHVTGHYAFGNDILGHYVDEHSISLDVLVLANDEQAAIDKAIQQSMAIVPEWGDDEDVKVIVAEGDAMTEYERRQAEMYSQQYGIPLFPPSADEPEVQP